MLPLSDPERPASGDGPGQSGALTEIFPALIGVSLPVSGRLPTLMRARANSAATSAGGLTP